LIDGRRFQQLQLTAATGTPVSDSTAHSGSELIVALDMNIAAHRIDLDRNPARRIQYLIARDCYPGTVPADRNGSVARTEHDIVDDFNSLACHDRRAWPLSYNRDRRSAHPLEPIALYFSVGCARAS
jgi:hypothetical protein